MSLVSVFITTSGRSEALKISKLLVQKRLVACANIFPSIDSIYRWDGKVETAHEAVIIAKTQKKHMKILTDVITSVHSYKNPCIVSLPIQGGAPEYLKWIKENT